MFAKQKKPVAPVVERPSGSKNANTTGTIVGEGISIEAANITGSGNVRIDGRFSGNISLDGHIIVGETGYVQGEIRAYSALFAGRFEGDMVIEDTVHLAPTSHVAGNIESYKIIMDEDAIFNGHCSMQPQKVEASQRTNNVLTYEAPGSEDQTEEQEELV